MKLDASDVVLATGLVLAIAGLAAMSAAQTNIRTPPVMGMNVSCTCKTIGYVPGPDDRPRMLLQCPRYYEECVHEVK